jgi:enoyl-CoA hydratase/carnithine racemase
MHMTTVRFEQDDAIGSVVLVNPPFNRIDFSFLINLREAVHRTSESNIRVLVVLAEGPNFSFGKQVGEWPGKSANWFRTLKLNQSCRAIEALRVPTLAAVQSLGQGDELRARGANVRVLARLRPGPGTPPGRVEAAIG